ncbi:MAG: hypothetical protein EVJ47_05350 [Candidatus Acidulodesulfobacterium ferriphilum]|jgi:hypothetical protein|uniref:TrbI/VirB10 family protein n=1 Tax=Candidatus Acidulodesulfobacterium ferriphilum TaxID=2597223 RepID=A0A519BBK5_9DELT|nr:MAG: hypothetical protein EVJ47_05350 [Candidatus Acidulodesulfobacterium ferriphilum]
MDKINKIDKNNPHVVREEDLEQTDPAAPDIYNSGIAEKNKFSNKDFLKFFKLPLVAVVFLIAIILALKFLFFHKSGKNISKDKKRILNLYKNKTIKDEKRFSPSVFNYAGGKGGKTATPEKPAKFNAKFNKEMKKLNGNIKFNKNSKNNGIYRQNSAYQNTLRTMPQINKKMIVFIKASYGKGILERERGINEGGHSVKAADYKPAPSKQNSDNNSRNKSVVIPQGTVVSAYIKYKVFSYNTEVPIIAILSNTFYYQGKAALEKGDEFFGTVSVKHSLNRLNILFNEIIKKSGHRVDIDAAAMMPDGSGGIKGDVHYRYAGNILASAAQGIASAASIFIGGGSGINSSNPYTFQNQIRENVAQNELNQAQNGINNYANSNQNISITLPKDTPIKIMFLKPAYIK